MPGIDRFLDVIDDAVTDPVLPIDKTAKGPTLKPLRLCCEAYPVRIGLLFVCVLHVFWNVLILQQINSVEPIVLVGIVIRPVTQTLVGAWALAGMPVVVLGGMGSMYKVIGAVRLYFYYLVGTFVVDSAMTLHILYEADVCTTVVPKSIRRLGTQLICGFSDTLVFVGLVVAGMVMLYCCYVVWSALQELQAESPSLLQYADAGGDPQPRSMGKSYGAAPPTYGYSAGYGPGAGAQGGQAFAPGQAGMGAYGMAQGTTPWPGPLPSTATGYPGGGYPGGGSY